ncbi:hypothetical protein [Paracoccus sp. SSJ]|uniref:hypothetical protein n=1 Tax=Paracoccus sp. SSJ TaxID=3050636 RepID=UPI002549EEA3|nr:hypothetical protein [Paracoccus sp. SSJ]MDK8871483.1 hypothetical protein [Paracoccus sp. SSJ]
MATQIAGPVRLPDGTIPAHGRVIFRPKNGGIVGATTVSGGAVIAPISGAGAIDVELVGRAGGTPYTVAVEHWSDVENRLVTTMLPDVVPTGAAGPFTLADLAAVEIPRDARSEAIWKRGDTINIGGQWIDEFGRPVDLAGKTVAAAMRGPDGVTRTLSVSVSDAAKGLLEISMPAGQTALLPLGPHAVDVKITNGARISRTQSGTINIVREVTP